MLATIQKGLPFDVATGGAFPQVMPAPYRVIYDTTASEQYGNVYPSWSSVMTCIALFSGPVEIYIRNGSQIPTSSGTFTSPYSMPTSWVLSTDSQGTTVPNGVYFSNSPLELKTDCNALLVFQESSGGATFTLSNPVMQITGCVIHLGAGNGTLINGASNQALLLRNVVVDTSGSGTLATGSSNVVTLLEQTVLQSNVLPASVQIFYDSTSHPNSQNGNEGSPLYPTISPVLNTVIYNPNAEAGGNVFTTWASLSTAIGLANAITVYVPESCSVESGTHAMPAQWFLELAGNVILTTNGSWTTMPSSITGIGALGIQSEISIVQAGSVSAASIVVGSTNYSLALDNVQLSSDGYTPVFQFTGHVGGGGTVNISVRGNTNLIGAFSIDSSFPYPRDQAFVINAFDACFIGDASSGGYGTAFVLGGETTTPGACQLNVFSDAVKYSPYDLNLSPTPYYQIPAVVVVRAATTAALTGATFTDNANQYGEVSYATYTFDSLPTIDGVSLNEGDLVLIKDQDDITNGVYLCLANYGVVGFTRLGTAYVSYLAYVQGGLVVVAQGTTNANTTWQLTTAPPIYPGPPGGSPIIYSAFTTGGGGGSVDATAVTYEPGDSSDWPTPPTQVAQALDELATTVASLGTPTTLIYDPSGAQAGSYTTFTALQAAISAANMAYVVVVMLGDPEAGSYNVAANWEMVIVPAGITLPDGITFSTPFRIRSGASGTIPNLISNSTTTVFQNTYNTVLDGVVVTSPSYPMFKPAGLHVGDFYCTLLNSAVLGDGTNPVINANDSAFNVYLNVYQQSTIEANALTACNFTVKYDAGSTVSSTQPGTNTLTITPLAGGGSVDASAVTYTPGNSGDWPSPPSFVNTGLDDIATILGGSFVPIGNGSSATVDGGVAVGHYCDSNSQGAVALGYSCTSSAQSAITAGSYCNAQGDGDVALGDSENSYSTGGGAVSLGDNNSAFGSEGLIAVGHSNSAGASGSSGVLAMGAYCSAFGDGGVSLGNNCSGSSSTTGVLTIGYQCNSNSPAAGTVLLGNNSNGGGGAYACIGIGNNCNTSNGGIAIGDSCLAQFQGSIAIGTGCQVSNADNSIVMGNGSQASAGEGISFGLTCEAVGNRSIVMGSNCASSVNTTSTMVTGVNGISINSGERSHTVSGSAGTVAMNYCGMVGTVAPGTPGNSTTLTLVDGNPFFLQFGNYAYSIRVTVTCARSNPSPSAMMFAQKMVLTTDGTGSTILGTGVQEVLGTAGYTMALSMSGVQLQIVVTNGASTDGFSVTAKVEYEPVPLP